MTKIGCVRGLVSWAFGVAIAVSAGGFARAAEPTVIIPFNPALGQLPESLTSDDHGTLYASNVSGTIQKIDPIAQTFTPLATIALPPNVVLTGIKVGPDGFIYVTSGSLSGAGAFLWRVSLDGSTVQKLVTFDPTSFPNDLVFQDDGSILLTDPFFALIYKVDPAWNVSVWLSDLLFAGNPDPNGQAFVGVHAFGVDGIAWGDRDKRELYVSNIDYGRVMRIPTDGTCAPTIHVIAEDPALKGVDGIAVDRSGTIWAAVNSQDRIATVDEHGRISVIAQGSPLDGPSSFAFGTGRHDKKTLYIANFAITRALSGQEAHPGILSLPVEVPGLPLR
jgi:sugar lactone lactonase YvrE